MPFILDRAGNKRKKSVRFVEVLSHVSSGFGARLFRDGPSSDDNNLPPWCQDLHIQGPYFIGHASLTVSTTTPLSCMTTAWWAY